MKIIKPDVAVVIGDPKDKRHGHMRAACIRSVGSYTGHYVTYEITWWDKNVRRTEWLTDKEFTVTNGAGYVDIGF